MSMYLAYASLKRSDLEGIITPDSGKRAMRIRSTNLLRGFTRSEPVFHATDPKSASNRSIWWTRSVSETLPQYTHT